MLDFFKTYKWDGRPFALVGMGPSFSHVHDYDLSGYNVLGINKVVREIPVDICHIIDWYIVDKVKESIDKQAGILLCPYFPHFGYRAHPELSIKTVYKNLSETSRSKLQCYNLCTTHIRVSDSPIMVAHYFNAEASLNLIANTGCKTVRAIGIDGGTGRADAFSDHGPCDPRGFDMQWANMAKTIKRFNLDYQNLDGSPINHNLETLLCQISSEQSHMSASS